MRKKKERLRCDSQDRLYRRIGNVRVPVEFIREVRARQAAPLRRTKQTQGG